MVHTSDYITKVKLAADDQLPSAAKNFTNELYQF